MNNNIDKHKVVFDLDMYGRKDSQGQIRVNYDIEVIKQSLTKWVISPRLSKMRSLSGGYILASLGKSLNNENAENIFKSIQDGLQFDFFPPITPLKLNVIPDYDNRKWIISLTGYIPLLKKVLIILK
jgi:hypothetical protein